MLKNIKKICEMLTGMILQLITGVFINCGHITYIYDYVSKN
jgi:hypothetical protein